MAGTHQIFSFDPATSALSRPRRHRPGGPGRRPGLGKPGSPSPPAWPWTRQGNIWVADSETSALRRLVLADDGSGGSRRDRHRRRALRLRVPRRRRRRRHACSTRWVSPCCRTARLPSPTPTTARCAATTLPPPPVSTLARGLNEPSDVLLDASVDGEPVLLVVETNNHQLVRLPLPAEALIVDEGASQTQRPKTKVAAGRARADSALLRTQGPEAR